MTLPATGTQISMSQVNTELNVASTTQISLNDTAVRGLAGKTINGSQIAMSDLQGKSGRVSVAYTYNSNTINLGIQAALVSGYVAGKTDLTITISAGVYIYSNSTSTPALYIAGFVSGDNVTVVNNGYIMGMGGKGGGTTGGTQVAGSAGGPALSMGCSITLANNGYILGGGGGGAGITGGGGGGAGGGAGGDYNSTYPGGIGGSPGLSGGTGSKISGYAVGGGGGGRVVPGTGGLGGYNTGGIGGGSGGGSAVSLYVAYGYYSLPSFAGGSGSAAGADSNSNVTSSGGGGWGAKGGSYGGTAGGAGGAAIQQNGNTLTYSATGTIYGSVVA